MRHPGDQADYRSIYRDFDSPLMRQIRVEAYGEDIGQHSWVTAAELRDAVVRLRVTAASEVLDLGAGPCGPLTFVVELAGCRGTALELDPAGLAVGRRRAEAMAIGDRVATVVGDLDRPLPFPGGSFDAALSLDVVLHLADRTAFYREVFRVLKPGGRFLVTDAGVVTGPISSIEIAARSARGPIRLVPPGWNEAQLESAGFTVIETDDRTPAALGNATGRLAAIGSHRGELEKAWGAEAVGREVGYLEAVIELSRRKGLARIRYLAERAAKG